MSRPRGVRPPFSLAFLAVARGPDSRDAPQSSIRLSVLAERCLVAPSVLGSVLVAIRPIISLHFSARWCRLMLLNWEVSQPTLLPQVKRFRISSQDLESKR